MIVVLLVGLNIPFLHIQTRAALILLQGTYAEFVEKRNFLGKCCLYWLINIYSIVDCTEIEKLMISVYVIVRQNNPFLKKKR